MIYFIDTNIFLRTLIKEEESTFKSCLFFLENIKHNKVSAVTSSIVLAEINWTLLSFYKVPKNDVVKSIRSIINLRGLRFIDRYNMSRALTLYADHSVKFIDALIASFSELSENKWTIVSYDRDFDTLGINRIEPQSVKL